MDSKPLKVLMTIVGVLAGIYVARHVVDWFRGEPAVPAEVLTKQWVVQSLGGGELRLEAPWPLNPTPVELPSTISKNVESSSSLSIEKDGLYILAARLKMIAAPARLRGRPAERPPTSATSPGRSPWTPRRRPRRSPAPPPTTSRRPSTGNAESP